MASLTSMSSILKEILDYVKTDIKTDKVKRCRQSLLFIHSDLIDLYVKNDCICVDDKIAIPSSIEEAYIEAIQATHP